MSKDSFSKRGYRSSLIKYLLFLVPPAIVAVVLLWFSTLRLWQIGVSSALALGFIIGCFFLPFVKLVSRIFEKILEKLFGRFTNPLLKKIFSFRRGYEGEEIVSSWVDQITGGWTKIPNIECIDEEGGRFFDIDLIVVGKKGVFVIEVKNYSDNLEFTENECFVVFPDGRKSKIWNDPRIQVKRNADYIDEILNGNGIILKSRQVVVSARNGSVRLEGKTGIYIADSKESLERYLLLDTANNLSDEEILRITEVIRKNVK